jgi:hypothetical protein
MLNGLNQRKVAHVLFDEAHGEAWSIRREVAEHMLPAHPQAASYCQAASLLAERDFTVAAHGEGALTRKVLAGADVLVIAAPTDGRWHTAVPGGAPVFAPGEINAIEAFVAAGGGLVVLTESEHARHGGNIARLLDRFAMGIESTTVLDYQSDDGATPQVVPGRPAGGTARTLLHLVDSVRFYGAGALWSDRQGTLVLRAGDDAVPAGAGLLAALPHGDGRVVVVADAELFGDDHVGELDHRQLWLNIAYWVALAAFGAEVQPIDSQTSRLPEWERLKAETNALRTLQEPNGEIDLERHDSGEVRGHVAAMIESIAALAPLFPHESEYLAQVPLDLQAWVDGGCGKPDFTGSLALFHPERHRRDGIENLVVFPMYTPNGSPDTRFEALIVRTPWPEFVDRLEREVYHNDKFVPVQLVDHTAGYTSECAVLFPETVSVAGRPTNYFGGIFCDRESARFRRTTLRGEDALRIELPPDAAALVASPQLSLQTYILWDLIHDSWHSHGDLPFDPFMIRQRLPYWMYSLEELRVDLASYVDSGRLARTGFPFARYVQYGILFDRILRFPITGNRVRNYDGLGGQLLFGYLHKNGVVHWTDNTLLIDWERVEEAVGQLSELIEDLYRRGIDLSKVSYWVAAHDLVSRYVHPNINSQWKRDSRVLSDEADPRAWVDRVLDDEFPLSMFYESVKKKLLEQPAPA